MAQFASKIFVTTLFVSGSLAGVPVHAGDDLDLRVRPLALVQAIGGMELGVPVGRRFELGPSAHYFSGTNEARGSALNVWEVGLKGTYLFAVPTAAPAAAHEGAYVSLAVYDYIAQVTQTFSTGDTATSSRFHSPGGTLTGGYQWNLGLFHSEAWTVRVGGGIGYKRQYVEHVLVDGTSYPVGARRRLDPTLELTLGVLL